MKTWEKMADLIEKPWEEYPDSIIIPKPAAALEYDVSGWRYIKPVVDYDRCTDCGICWLYCPDNAIEYKEGKMKGFRYYHCKGCGICADVCPVNAIEMVEEMK